MVLVLRRCLRIISGMTALYVIPSLLWLVLIQVELGNCPVPGTKNIWSSTPVLCSEILLYIIVCEVDVIANLLVLYLPFCSTLNTNFFYKQLLNEKTQIPYIFSGSYLFLLMCYYFIC